MYSMIVFCFDKQKERKERRKVYARKGREKEGERKTETRKIFNKYMKN